MHLVDYYLNAGYNITKTEPAAYYGPCPECGGTDRFIIFKKTKRKSICQDLGGYSCNRGCKIGGDCITFLMRFCQKTYPEALNELGLENPAKNSRYQQRKNPPRQKSSLSHFSSRRMMWQPRGEEFANFVESPKKWKEHAEKFVLSCHEAVLDRQKTLDYLSARGVTEDLVRLYKIGFNAGQVSKKKGQYQPAYRQAAAWGMPNLRRPKDNSLQKTISLQAGLTIPCYASYNSEGADHDSLLRINIRPFFDDYRIVKGSLHFLQTQIIINPGKEIALVIESELDGVALGGILPDVTIICMGSAGGRPGVRTHDELRDKQLILLCLDSDRSTEKDIAAHCKKYPDSPEPVFALGAGVDRHPEEWFANYPQCEPFYCPAGNFWIPPEQRNPDGEHGKPIKDPGDAIRAGCDMASWFAEGVVYYSVAVPHAVSASPDMSVSKGGRASAAENLLAFAVFFPEHAGKLFDSVKNYDDVRSVCRLMIDRGIHAEGLLDATEGGLLDKIRSILIAGVHCWDWSANPEGYLRMVSRPSPPASDEWVWLIGYLERRQIDIKVIDGVVSLVFNAAIGDSVDGDLERVSCAVLRDDVAEYLGQAKNGVWKAEVFR